MSVVDIESPKEPDKKDLIGKCICYDCARDIEASINVGLPETGYCAKCIKSTKLYLVES